MKRNCISGVFVEGGCVSALTGQPETPQGNSGVGSTPDVSKVPWLKSVLVLQTKGSEVGSGPVP